MQNMFHGRSRKRNSSKRFSQAVMVRWFAHLSNCCEQKLQKFSKQFLLSAAWPSLSPVVSSGFHVTNFRHKLHSLPLWIHRKIHHLAHGKTSDRSCHQAAKTFRIKLRAFCSKLLVRWSAGCGSSRIGSVMIPNGPQQIGVPTETP